MFENKNAAVNPNAAVTSKPANAVTPNATVTTDLEAVKRAKKNEASKKMIERKKAAIAKLVDLAKRLGTPEEKAAAAYLSGEGRVKGEKSASATKDWVKEIFGDAKTISEDLVFKATHMGRNEMRALCKKLSTKEIFINFDAEKGIYSVTDEAGYTGPKVIAKKI